MNTERGRKVLSTFAAFSTYEAYTEGKRMPPRRVKVRGRDRNLGEGSDVVSVATLGGGTE